MVAPCCCHCEPFRGPNPILGTRGQRQELVKRPKGHPGNPASSLPLSGLCFPDCDTGAAAETPPSAPAPTPRSPPLSPLPWAQQSARPTPAAAHKPTAQEFTRRLQGNGLSARTPAPAGCAPDNNTRPYWLQCRLRQPIQEGACLACRAP